MADRKATYLPVHVLFFVGEETMVKSAIIQNMIKDITAVQTAHGFLSHEISSSKSRPDKVSNCFAWTQRITVDLPVTIE